MLVLVPLLCLSLFCATNAFKIYARNRAIDTVKFPSAVAPAPGQSILIVSPHPDDETLGAAGLVQDALRNHVPIHVVFLTDGDAFRVGVARYYKVFRVSPSDYVRYGLMREEEARGALGSLGLPASDITFLGYPDQGLLPIFRAHWQSSEAYTSPYSKRNTVPYPDAYHPGSVFCGESVTNDLASVIEKCKPTDIYVTHPSDDHPDHSAAPGFLNVALTQLAAKGDLAAQSVHVHYFLVHRGDWPVPQGLNDKVALAPPSEMTHLDTFWSSLAMDRDQTSHKHVALLRYGSQQEMMGRFLSSFVRPNELFGQLDTFVADVPEIAPSQINLNGDVRGWPTTRPIDCDPVGDTVLRDFQSSADLRTVYACADDKNLYVRVDTVRPLSQQINYNLYMRGFDATGKTHDNGVTLSFCPQNVSQGIAVFEQHGMKAAWSGNTMEASIPLSLFGAKRPDGVYIEAASLFSRLIVDRTGMRYAHLQPIAAKLQPSHPLS